MSNLPPGCKDSDIPGWRPCDELVRCPHCRGQEPARRKCGFCRGDGEVTQGFFDNYYRAVKSQRWVSVCAMCDNYKTWTEHDPPEVCNGCKFLGTRRQRRKT